MIELYHWEPNASSGRAILCLTEKSLDFQSHYVDVLAFEQHRPAFLDINRSGEVPVLVHEGEIYTQATCIEQYLDEAFPQVPLMPSDALSRWRVRYWQKWVDETVAPAVSLLAWDAYGLASFAGRPADELETALKRIPSPERRAVWSDAIAGYSADAIADTKDSLAHAIEEMETQLAQTPWLAGAHYSLAEIATFPFAGYFAALVPELVNPAATPKMLAWLSRIAERPAVREMLSTSQTGAPFMISAPGSERIRWG